MATENAPYFEVRKHYEGFTIKQCAWKILYTASAKVRYITREMPLCRVKENEYIRERSLFRMALQWLKAFKLKVLGIKSDISTLDSKASLVLNGIGWILIKKELH